MALAGGTAAALLRPSASRNLTGSDAMEDEASSLRCIADKPASGKPTSK